MERVNSVGSSIRRRSLSISSQISHHTDNDDECESVSEAGDIGDRGLPSKRFSESNSFHMSFNSRSENDVVVSNIPEEYRLHPNSSIRPLPPALTSTDAIVGSGDTKHVSSLENLMFMWYEILVSMICFLINHMVCG